jgi:anti-sigma factor RsiW
MADPAEDALLTAYLDGELSPDEVAAVASRLANEAGLRARLEELREGEVALRSAFTGALSEAPREAMTARLARATRRRAPAWVPEHWRRAAAVAILAFMAGLAVSRFLYSGPPETESWRQSVAEYMALYTPASFAPRDEATLRDELAALSKSIGVELSQENLSVGALAPRGGVLLQFNGAPLVQIGYVLDDAPAAFCIIRNGEPDAAPKRRRLGDFNVVSWAKAGRGFMVLSAVRAGRLDDLAGPLQDRFAFNASTEPPR